MMKSLGVAAISVYLAWVLLGAAANLVLSFTEWRNYAASIPQPLSGKTIPIDICDNAGRCGTVYVTDSVARAFWLETDVNVSGNVGVFVGIVTMILLGEISQRRRKRRAALAAVPAAERNKWMVWIAILFALFVSGKSVGALAYTSSPFDQVIIGAGSAVMAFVLVLLAMLGQFTRNPFR